MAGSPLASIKILAVEDHADTRKMLKLFLQWSGADVTMVESGSAALDLIQKQKPDILLVDISMPQMDGFELLKYIRSLGREIASVPAIACTALGSKEDMVRMRHAGFRAHITKPMDPDLLVATILNVNHSAGTEDQLIFPFAFV